MGLFPSKPITAGLDIIDEFEAHQIRKYGDAPQLERLIARYSANITELARLRSKVKNINRVNELKAHWAWYVHRYFETQAAHLQDYLKEHGFDQSARDAEIRYHLKVLNTYERRKEELEERIRISDRNREGNAQQLKKMFMVY